MRLTPTAANAFLEAIARIEKVRRAAALIDMRNAFVSSDKDFAEMLRKIRR